MPSSETPSAAASSRALTLAACASFLPIGIATVLLGPLLPVFSARWSLNYSQAGALFAVQYVASTVGVALSGTVVSRWGFRFAMQAGMALVGLGIAFLTWGPEWLAILCISAYGAGQAIAVPAANLVVAEMNPARRSASLNLLNFCWSAGAVACPFLIAAAIKNQHLELSLAVLAGLVFLVAFGIGFMPSFEAASSTGMSGVSVGPPGILWKHRGLIALGAMFLVYVGTENAFGGWVASYAKSLGNMTPAISLMTPAFFYAAITIGRSLAPLILRLIDEIRLAQIGLLIGFAGSAGLLLSHDLRGIVISACIAGFGLSSVYPTTISLLSREFGSAAARVGSIMFTLSNVGGGLFPWIVGISSSHFGGLKTGLIVPLIGCAILYALYLRDWKPSTVATQ
jgi:fucose permease